MTTTRAETVAEILWELKKAEKLATFTEIAQRAGFSPGANGRSMMTCLKHVRKDWPHLQWWRAVRDDVTIEKGSEQEDFLASNGFELTESDNDGDALVLVEPDSCLLQWSEASNGEAE